MLVGWLERGFNCSNNQKGDETGPGSAVRMPSSRPFSYSTGYDQVAAFRR